MSPNPQETYPLKKCRIALPLYRVTTFLSCNLVPRAKQEKVLSFPAAAPSHGKKRIAFYPKNV